MLRSSHHHLLAKDTTMDFTATTQGLTTNPIDGSYGYTCREHGISRSGLSQRHATNVEAKHIREHHGEHAPASINLTAGAEYLMHLVATDADAYRAARKLWNAMTDLAPAECLPRNATVTATVAPF